MKKYNNLKNKFNFLTLELINKKIVKINGKIFKNFKIRIKKIKK
jgi:hypothetical protein